MSNKSWSDEQWDKLENYLMEFGHLNTNNTSLYDLQLQFLCEYIGSDANTIKQNMQVLIDNGAIKSREDFNWESSKLKLMNEVDNIILSLNLKPFKEFKPDSAADDSNDTTDNAIDTTPIAQLHDMQPTYLDTVQVDKPRLPKPPSKTDMPSLSSTQRRMSLDLIKGRPNLNQLHRASSLNKPALTSTSNINVLAKPEVATTGTQPRTANGKESGKPFLQAIFQKGHNVRRQPSKIKMARRVSMVDERLPEYIRKQLAEDTKTLSKKSSRLNNLLATSDSLYYNKDSSLKSGSTTILSDPANTTGDDNEYVLPTLFSHYGLRDNTGDVDLVDVEHSQDDTEDNLSIDGNDDHDYEDDDDYLFTI